MSRARIALGMGLVMLALYLAKSHWAPALLVGSLGMMCLLI